VAEDPRRQLGGRGEDLARRHFEAQGYEIVDRNFRTRYGELDLVASNARSLVFCEVKTRVGRRRQGEASGPSPLGPFASIGPRKRRQVRLMAREWLAANRNGRRRRPPELRFDAIGITLNPAGGLVTLEHLEAAF
jgi:putative endonuclease